MRRILALLLVFIFVMSTVASVTLAQDENHPPSADAGPDKYVEVENTVYFDGLASSDPDEDPLNYSWDFDISDGIQADASGAIVSTIYYAVGDYIVTLTVDDGNMSDTDTTTVFVQEEHTNRAPTAVITEPGDYSFHDIADPVKFDGSGSTDPDGDLLTYDWNFGDGDEDSGVVVYHLYKDIGVMTVTLTVSDGEFDSETSITIFIEGTPGVPIPPPPPIPNVERPMVNADGPYYYMAMDEVYLISTSDAGGGSASYCWDLDQSNGIQAQKCEKSEEEIAQAWENDDWDVATGPFPVVAYKEPGNYTITLILKVGYGKTYNPTGNDVIYLYNYTTTTAVITEHETVEADAGKDMDIESGEKTTLIGRASVISKYENEWFEKCRWDFESDGIWDWEMNFEPSEKLKKITCSAIHTYVLNETTKNDTVYVATFDVEVHGTLRLYPTTNTSNMVPYDYPFNVQDTTNRTIPAPPNQVPVIDCGDDLTGSNAVFVGESVSFVVSAYDPDDDMIVLYEWDFDNDGRVDFSNPATGDTTYIYKSAGSYVARLNVTDDRDGVGYCFLNVTVKTNNIPVAVISSEERADAGEEVNFDGSESYDYDGPDEIESYLWDFDARDGITTEGSGQYVSHTFSKGGSYTVTLKVKDRHGAEALATWDIEIVQSYGVTIDLAGKNTQEVVPGSSYTFNVKVINTGNGDDCFDIHKSGTKSTWGEFSTNELCLITEEARDLTLRVSVPLSAKAEDQALIKIEAVSQGSSSVSDIIQVRVNAKQSYGVSVYMAQVREEIKQKESTSMAFRVTNLGNGEDTFKLAADGDSRSWVNFKKSSLNLDAGETKEVTVVISVPGDAKTGEHIITLSATSSGNTGKKSLLAFTVVVKEGKKTSDIPSFEIAGTLIALSVVFIAVYRRRR